MFCGFGGAQLWDRDCVTLLRKVPRAHCGQWLEILRPVAGARSRAFRFYMHESALVRVVSYLI